MTPPAAIGRLAAAPRLYAALRWFVAGALRLCGQVVCHGLENVPAQGAAILAAHHESILDPFLIGVAIRRRPGYLVYYTYYQRPLLGTGIRWLGGIPVGRGSPSRSLAAAGSFLRSGEVLEIFPEGERAAEGRVLPFQRGFARLARQTATPVVPVAIVGAGRVWPPGRILPRPGRIDMFFGHPMAPPAESAVSPAVARRLEREFAESVRRAVLELAAGRLRFDQGSPTMGGDEPIGLES